MGYHFSSVTAFILLFVIIPMDGSGVGKSDSILEEAESEGCLRLVSAMTCAD